MPYPTLQEEVTALSAKVTALVMLVEALYVDDLARDDNAAAIGQRIIKSVLANEEKARGAVGELDYSLQISDAATSLIDRAVARAIAFRVRRHSSKR